jgi:predicted transposase YdaD
MRESSTYQAILEEGRKEGRKEGQAKAGQRLVLRLGTKTFGPATEKFETAVRSREGDQDGG